MINFAIREQELYQRFIRILSLLTTLILFGTLGFMLLENWNFLDAFYMAVITVSTIGYMEIHPLSSAGRIFNSCFILTSVGVVAYSFTVMARMIVDGELENVRVWRRMNKEIEKLKGHTIVCGFGRLAETLVKELIQLKKDVVVIESDPHILPTLTDLGVPFVSGSAYEDETLKQANIQNASNLLALLPKDADNVYITLCARELNPGINIVARSEGGSGEKKLRQAGATDVIAPYRVAGVRLAQQINRPHVSEFLELAGMRRGSSQLILEEVIVPKNSQSAGKTLLELELRGKTGAFVAAIITKEGETIVNPDSKVIVDPGATLVVLGKPESVDALGAFFS